ncbi:MAG: hypothetical protein PQJ50_12670 [Spirochaetales bacterium]|nr:hypothetical protein [Spirochaetales bacterium]
MNLKKLLLTLSVLTAAVMISSCGSDEKNVNETAADVTGITLENAFYFDHVNGHGVETEMPGLVLFEYEQLRSVRYQVAYVACTCRGPEVNYWSVANIEISKDNGAVVHLSYGEDSTDHYTAGLYGDSIESWDGTPVKALFDQFISENILDKSQDEINAYEAMHGNVDTYTGATVTPNNAMRMLQGLFIYHNERY